MRICLAELDQVVAGRLPIDAVIRKETQSILVRTPHLIGAPAVLTRKVKRVLQAGYGVTPTAETISPIVKMVIEALRGLGN